MSMLAEPRSRQKWSEDPRNTRWASGKTKWIGNVIKILFFCFSKVVGGEFIINAC